MHPALCLIFTLARAALEAPSEREVRSGLCAMAFVVRSARVVDQKLAEARARLRRVEPEERLRVFVRRGPAEGGGRGGEQYESRHLLVAEGPRDDYHDEHAEEDRVDPGIIRGLAVAARVRNIIVSKSTVRPKGPKGSLIDII